MELQRILARDTRSAMELAIKTYGPDVLVISNHQVGGQTELVVALEVAPEETPEAVTAPAPAAAETAPPAMSFRQSLDEASKPQSAAPAPVVQVQAAPEAAPDRSEQDARDYLRSREIVDLVRDEISALRREFRMRQQTTAWQAGLSFAPEVTPLVQALQDAGIPGGLRTLLLDSLAEVGNVREGLDTLRAQLVHHLQRPAGALPLQGLHLLAGPSGAGKSLMAARLARQAAEAGCEQVALISYQDVRAGAWSQTQMLAAQLGIDAFRASDAPSLRLLVNELSTRRLVLIDTPGVQMTENVSQVLAQAAACRCHAVVSADASGVTLQRVLGQGLPFQSLLLTKVDEASTPWALLQFLSDNPLTLAGASHGARLTDLMPHFDIAHLVDLALAPLAEAVDMGASPVVSTLAAPPPQIELSEPVLAAPAAALSSTMQSIASLPAVPVFLATADVLGAAPVAKRASRSASSKAVAKTVTKPAAKTAAKASAKTAVAEDKPTPARRQAAAAAAPAVPKRARAASLAPVAPTTTRRKAASAAAAHA